LSDTEMIYILNISYSNKKYKTTAKNNSIIKQVLLTFPKLKPTTKSISIRLPQALIEDLKILANKRDVPYQSLLKVFLAEKVDDEFGRKRVG